MATITALNVRLGMDASNFSAGADLARAEVNKVAATMRQSTPPAEKFKKDVDLLNKAFSESGKQSKEYAQALEFLRNKYGQVDPAAKKASSSINQIKQSMLNAVPGGHMFANMLKGPAGAMIALGAAAAIAIRGMKQAAERIDETAKAARSLGFAYRDLIGIQMLAGEVTGLDAATVNRGLGQFVKRLAEARVDGGKLKETMAALGLDVDKLAASAPADAFKAVSTAIAGIADKSEQVRIATLLVGKEGYKMVELFRQGGAAIDKMVQEAERLGAALSDQQVSEIESMNDAFGRVGMSIQGIWNSLLSQLAPTLTNIAKLASDFFVMVRKAGEAYAVMHPAVAAIGFLVNAMIEGFRGFIAVVSDSISLFASIPGAIFGGGKLNTSLSESGRLLDEYRDKTLGLTGATKSQTEAEEEAAIVRQRAQEAIDKFNKAYEKRLQDLQIESVALAGNVELAERMRLQAEGYSDAQIDAIQAMQQQNAAIKERIAAEAEAAKAAEAAEKKRKDDFWKDYDAKVKAIEDIESDFTIEVESAMKAAKDFFDNERQQDDQRRKDVSAGPGAGMEAGSAEAAKFMADQVNDRIGAASVPPTPTPGEKEIADKAEELLLAQRDANTKQDEELKVMKDLLVAFKDNGFKRAR